MNHKAIINGREYTRLAVLPSLDSGLPLVLCQDASGRRAVCSEALWRDSAHQDGLAAPVHALIASFGRSQPRWSRRI